MSKEINKTCERSDKNNFDLMYGRYKKLASTHKIIEK